MPTRQTDLADVPHVNAASGTRAACNADAKGTLILIGGACTPYGHALGCFIELSDARKGGPIVGIMAASTEEAEAAHHWSATLRALGATDVQMPMFDRSNPETDAHFATLIASASGVFLGGGDQVKLVSALSGTATCAAMRKLYKAGGVICGTSAGAAALTELTMAGGEIDLEGNLVEQYIGPGLGFLGYNAIIDTHFSQRRRLQRLFFVVAANRQLFGIGIDEDTALVVRGKHGQVMGAGGVTFVDGRDTVRFDNAGELERGRQLTLSHLRVGIVGTRYSLDLAARDLDQLVAD